MFATSGSLAPRAGITAFLAASALVAFSAVAAASPSGGPVLVADPFLDGYDGWTDVWNGALYYPPGPNWGILLQNNRLSESSNGRPGDGVNWDGKYAPFVMVNTSLESPPASYTLSATLRSSDDDGFGVVFGYQDTDYYFRVGLRNESGAKQYGFPAGVSVQKIVDGVITQLGTNDFTPSTANLPVDVDVVVDGTQWTVFVDGSEMISGNDPELAPGHYGVHSWGQKHVVDKGIQWGTQLDGMTISWPGGSRTHDFAGASPVAWRPVTLRNSYGGCGVDGEDLGNFRLDFRDGTIREDSNGYEWATTRAPNVDFLGPAVVVDAPESAAWTDYEMKVRLANGDDDGIGLLVRVADDDTFYRLNFSRQSMASSAGREHERAPQGLSIQKCVDGVWSELLRDNQSRPLYTYTKSYLPSWIAPFDVTVRVVGDTIQVTVIDDPDGEARVIQYDPIVDETNPILHGSVGFTSWGNGDAPDAAIFARFGGGGHAFLVAVPEPGGWVLALAALAAASLIRAVRRRR
ncbi:MAG: hypothetical protein JW809_18800 [Pirellulales bacterium]|nr:hypothetical protein [Pirellulales bacterium]